MFVTIGVISATLIALTGAYTGATATVVPGPAQQFDSTCVTSGHRTGVYQSAEMSVEATLAPRDANGLPSALRWAYTPGSDGPPGTGIR